MYSTGLIPWRRSLRESGEALLDLICPPSCAACTAGIARGELCQHCADELIGPLPPLCPRCGRIRPAAAPSCPHSHDCLTGIAAARHAFDYRGSAGALVRRLKFEHDAAAGCFLVRSMLPAMRQLLRQRQGERSIRCLALVSVPLHPRKLRSRGMDQAAWLAEGLTQRAGITFLPGVLRRMRETMPQGDPRVTSRAHNVADAFGLRRPRAVRGKRVILVDDVYTSGSTARECAALLRAGGCREVLLLTAARG